MKWEEKSPLPRKGIRLDVRFYLGQDAAEENNESKEEKPGGNFNTEDQILPVNMKHTTSKVYFHTFAVNKQNFLETIA